MLLHDLDAFCCWRRWSCWSDGSERCSGCQRNDRREWDYGSPWDNGHQWDEKVRSELEWDHDGGEHQHGYVSIRLRFWLIHGVSRDVEHDACWYHKSLEVWYSRQRADSGRYERNERHRRRWEWDEFEWEWLECWDAVDHRGSGGIEKGDQWDRY